MRRLWAGGAGISGFERKLHSDFIEPNVCERSPEWCHADAGPGEFSRLLLTTPGSGDAQNTNFDRSTIRANPKVLSQAEAGDLRLSKIEQDPAYQKALPDNSAVSDIIFLNITGPTTPLPIIINEELVLMRAEALWGLNRDAEALALVNLVRQNSGGLLPRTLASFPTRLDIVREILRQKRYSLLFESGSRLVDHRMFGLYAEMGMELVPPVAGPQVIPFPSAEANARNGDLACTP